MEKGIKNIKAEVERLLEEANCKRAQAQEDNDQESYIAWNESIATCRKILKFINETSRDSKIKAKKNPHIWDLFKLTCNIHLDIETVRDAVGYTTSLINGLVEESTGQMNIKENPKNIAVFVDMLELQTKIKQCETCVERLCWDEERRMYGPLAGKDYLL